VVVNDDQLSLAIGKRGQNVRLAAQLAGWDVDILTSPEFQAGVKRLEQNMLGIEGVKKEMVDKAVALGLIDVRDIEEVGVEPLIEELNMDKAVAEKVVAKCSVEARIVAQEQEAKKAADTSAKAGTGPKPPAAVYVPGERETDVEPSLMPDGMESVGGAPETVVHAARTGVNRDELSREERAIKGLDDKQTGLRGNSKEESETAALAEGRVKPPKP